MTAYQVSPQYFSPKSKLAVDLRALAVCTQRGPGNQAELPRSRALQPYYIAQKPRA